MDRKANSYPILDDIGGVFFDCWGTLLHEKEDRRLYFKRIFDHCLNKESVSVEDAIYKGLKFWDDYQKNTRNDVRIDAFVSLFCLMFGIKLDCPVKDVSEKIIDDIAGEPVDGVEEFLKELNRRQIYHGVISNTVFSSRETEKIIRRKLKDNGMSLFFFSDDYALRKPYPLIFQAALKKAGVPKENARFIGDSFVDDVVGSNRFGFKKTVFLGYRPSQVLLSEKKEYSDVRYVKVHDYQDLVQMDKEEI